MARLPLIAQPFVVSKSSPAGILHNGVSILDTNGITQPPDRFCAAPKVSELPIGIQIGGVPDNMIMDALQSLLLLKAVQAGDFFGRGCAYADISQLPTHLCQPDAGHRRRY